MINSIKFSVSMCVYGGDDPSFFKAAVDSVIDQTVMPDEIVLVVDGPVPEELDSVIREYEELKLFKVIRLERNVGHGDARRKSLENCTYELVALMDADDISRPDRFEKQLAAFERMPEASIVGGNIAEFIGDEGNVVGRRIVPAEHNEIVEYMKKRCPFNQMTVMFRKSEVEAAGGYLDWYCDEDYYLWLRMFLNGAKFANLEDILVNVRVGEEMYKRRGGIKYFKSEAKLQKFMFRQGIIGVGTYVMNVAKRLILQVLMPNSLRGYIFKRFARS